MGFSENLKKFRKIKKLTQKELAEKTNISFRTIQNYEAGKTWPKSEEKVSILCSVLEITYAELFSGAEMPDVPIVQVPENEDAYALVSKISGLFAGGTLPEKDKDTLMVAIIDAYNRSKTD